MSLDGFVQLIFNVYEAFTVALFVNDGENLSCFSVFTFATSFDKARPVPIDGTLPGWVAKHKEALIIGNFDKDEETLGYYGKSEDIKSFMAYPLETPGVIVVDSKKKWVFTDKEKKILAHFVSILSKEVEQERHLREMEEECEDLALTRRVLGFLRESRTDASSVVEEALKEGLSASGADLAVAGVQRKGRLRIIGSVGTGAAGIAGAECSSRASIASTVVEGGREFLLPYESSYLREKPLFFQNDGIRAKQYFGFPLMVDEKPYGFVGFASLSMRRLREGSIGVLGDMAELLSLFLARHGMQEEMEARSDRDPTSGALRFRPFLDGLMEMVGKKKDFFVVSVRLLNLEAYNRKLGVETVDGVLRKMHQGIEYCSGRNVLITRSGGGHFYAAMRGADVPEGENILNTIKFTILGSISDDVVSAKKAIEIGAAYFPRDSEDPWKLLDISRERGRGNTE